MRYARFQQADFAEYRQWFSDPDLNKHLGPMDHAWLDYVLTDTTGMELSCFQGGELVAVVGICYPTAEHATYVITDLAVNPALRGTGIGRTVLEQLVRADELAATPVWLAYVMADNPGAKAFFERLGWTCIAVPSPTDDKYTFTYRTDTLPSSGSSTADGRGRLQA